LDGCESVLVFLDFYLAFIGIGQDKCRTERIVKKE